MILTPADLVRLLRKVSEGDRAAFANLYRATSAKLYGVIFRISRRKELAEEILQEVYLRIWDRAGDFEPGRASAIAWMATIARNRALDEVRRRGLTLSGTDLSELEIPDSGRLPSEAVEMADDLRRLESCLDGLEAERGDAIRLAYLSGLSRQELAERFDKPVGTIKTWLYRGLKQLKECLER